MINNRSAVKRNLWIPRDHKFAQEKWEKQKRLGRHQLVTCLNCKNEWISLLNSSADNKWAAHATGDLVGDDQAGGHAAGKHRTHHVKDAGCESPRHRHPCSLSPAGSKEAIPRTPSLQSGNTNKTTMVEYLSLGGDRLNSDELTSHYIIRGEPTCYVADSANASD